MMLSSNPASPNKQGVEQKREAPYTESDSEGPKHDEEARPKEGIRRAEEWKEEG